MASSAPLASIVIATLDRPMLLEACLDSLEEHGGGLDREVVVVDQSRGDATGVVCRGRPGVRYIHSASRGISRNRNLGARLARGEWVVFADDDGRFGPGWGEAALRAMSSPDAPDLVAGIVVVPSTGLPLAPIRDPRPGDIRPDGFAAVLGASIHVRRAVFEALGGFDERMGTGATWGASEEADLVLRLLEAGLAARLDPSVVIHHAALTPPTRGQERRFFRYGMGTGALFRKHLGGPQGRRLLRIALRHLLLPAVDALGAARDGPAAIPCHLATLAGRWAGLLTYPAPPFRRPRGGGAAR